MEHREKYSGLSVDDRALFSRSMIVFEEVRFSFSCCCVGHHVSTP